MTKNAQDSQQADAKKYARIRRRLALGSWCFGAAYLAVWIAGGWAKDVEASVASGSLGQWIAVLAVIAAIAVPYSLLTFPLSVYSGFVLPHRFGQSRQSFRQWLWDRTKGGIVGGAMGLVMVEGLYAIMRWQPSAWWLWASAAVLLVNVLLTHLAPILLFPLFFKFVPLESPELQGRLLDVCKRAGTSVRGVFTFDLGTKTRAANAALAGLGNTRRILLSDTLCEEYTPDEIEVILAHELGHHVHGHLMKGIALSTVSTLSVFGVAHIVLQQILPALGVAGISSPAGLPVLAAILSLLSIAGMPIGNGISRGFERQADAAALRLASTPLAMVSAMEKLADHNLADLDPHPFVVWWFHSHPPIQSRVSAARSFVEQAPAGV